ncbi:unnamed protein product [Mytilus coruscus]|uniref:Uncharacterized protein n=1 Tax=Mytilus coruscus TaxID=42192 RepID=A0A6J7ZXU2_MYTCO|nr:unnamed protein product [Mytilus coruscus]
MINYSHDSLWIGDDKFDIIKHVKLTKDNIQVISQFGIPVYDMTITSHNNLLLSVLGDTKLRLLNVKTGQRSDSNYNVAPFLTFGIRVTNEQRVIIGAVTPTLLPGICRKVVIVIDEHGNHLTQYEHGRNNKPLFRLPHRITSTSNGRVIVLHQTGSIVQTYEGHQDINSRNISFDPQDILTTPGETVVIADCNNHTLQILDHDGVIITYIKTDDVGIGSPSSLTQSGLGYFYIGCAFYMKSTTYEHVKAKLYEVQYSGFEEIE